MITRITEDNHPLEIFADWFDDALSHGETDPNAMALATVNADLQPNVRMVLYKGLSHDGAIQFYSNYHSHKATELAQNPHAAVVFYWPSVYKQVRFTGMVRKMTRAESETYFASRPRESQLGAIASPQSQVITSRDELEQKFAKLKQDFTGKDIPCPEHWGGYLLQPATIEFWWGRRHRLHDRYCFRLQNERWQLDRLAP